MADTLFTLHGSDLTRAENPSPPGSSLLQTATLNRHRGENRKDNIMSSQIHFTITIRWLIPVLALVGFALLPGAHALVPTPDGGYPNFTTAEGTNALANLTSGGGNTAVGW